jgi:hypothetical protein
MLLTFLIYLTTHTMLMWKESALKIYVPGWMRNPYFYMLTAIFLLAMDFWAWGKIKPVVMGIPLWMIYFICLSGIQTAVMFVWVRQD